MSPFKKSNKKKDDLESLDNVYERYLYEQTALADERKSEAIELVRYWLNIDTQ